MTTKKKTTTSRKPTPIASGVVHHLRLPQPAMTVVRVKLRGRAPGLLLNPFSQKAEAMLLASMQKKKAKVARPDKDIDRDYREMLAEVAIDPKKGLYWINALSFKAAMCRGAKSVDKLAMTDVRGGIFVQEDSITHDGKPAAHIIGTPTKFTCHVANKGSADLRTRVLLKDWQYELVFTVNESMLSLDQALTCLANAGVSVGVGDWRPEKAGVHGRWDLVEAYSETLKEVEFEAAE